MWENNFFPCTVVFSSRTKKYDLQELHHLSENPLNNLTRMHVICECKLCDILMRNPLKFLDENYNVCKWLREINHY